MARRELQEINAGSMADIAFLLLIFWLVTTTIESDMGIKRQLPPPVPPDIDVPQAKEQNVFNVKVNFLDMLLVEGQPLDIQELKNKTKSFLIATGDGVITHQIGTEEIGKNRDVILITGANGKTNAWQLSVLVALLEHIKSNSNNRWGIPLHIRLGVSWCDRLPGRNLCTW